LGDPARWLGIIAHIVPESRLKRQPTAFLNVSQEESLYLKKNHSRRNQA
jgi:hypothetical protein